MRTTITTLATLALVALAGCGSLPQTEATTLNQANAPKFTEEEKEAMTVEERAQIYNDNVPERDRVICRREKRVGSHMPVTTCRTVAEAEMERRAAQDVLSERDPYAWRPQQSDRNTSPGTPTRPGGRGGGR